MEKIELIIHNNENLTKFDIDMNLIKIHIQQNYTSQRVDNRGGETSVELSYLKPTSIKNTVLSQIYNIVISDENLKTIEINFIRTEDDTEEEFVNTLVYAPLNSAFLSFNVGDDFPGNSTYESGYVNIRQLLRMTFLPAAEEI